MAGPQPQHHKVEQEGGFELRDKDQRPAQALVDSVDHSPGLLAGTADPVLLFLLVEAATFTNAVFAIHNLAFGVEEGEWRAAMYAEVLGELLVLGESGALLSYFLTHLTENQWCGERWGDKKKTTTHQVRELSTPGTRSLLLPYSKLTSREWNMMEDNVRKAMHMCVTGSLCCTVEN